MVITRAVRVVALLITVECCEPYGSISISQPKPDMTDSCIFLWEILQVSLHLAIIRAPIYFSSVNEL